MKQDTTSHQNFPPQFFMYHHHMPTFKIQVEANLTLRSDSGIGASSTGEQISANHHQCYYLSTNFSCDSNRVDLMPANERDERLARALFADVQVLSDTKIPLNIIHLFLLLTSISWKQVGHLRWKFLFFFGSPSVNDIFATKMTVMPANIL